MKPKVSSLNIQITNIRTERANISKDAIDTKKDNGGIT